MTNKHPLESVAEALEEIKTSEHTHKARNIAFDALATLREYMAETQPVSEITENVLQEIDLNDLFFDLLALDENEITQKYGKIYTKGKQNDQ